MFIARKIIIIAGKIFLSLIFLIVILELGVRVITFVRYKSYFNRYLSAKYRKAINEIEEISGMFDNEIVMDPICYYTMRGGFFRGPKGQFNPIEKGPDEVRIICVGDSTTFGMFVDYNSTYPMLLEKLLQKEYPEEKVSVLNAGIPGASSRQVKRVFQLYVANYKPDIVIWRKGAMLTDSYEILPIPKQRILLWNFLYKSRLFRIINVFMDKGFPDKPTHLDVVYNFIMGTSNNADPQCGFNSNFDIIKKIALDNGVKHVLAVDFIYNISNKYLESDYQHCLDVHVKPLLITFGSFKEALHSKKINDIFIDECHMTKAGTTIIASEIFEFIVDNGWIDG